MFYYIRYKSFYLYLILGLFISGCDRSSETPNDIGNELTAPAEEVASSIAEENIPKQQQEEITQAPIELKEGLPTLTACTVNTRPVLPAKWTASGLMQAFGEYDVVLGKFTYDEAAQAYRFSLSRPGQSTFTDYLLTADKRLYVLQGPYEQPTSCRYSLILNMDLPSREPLSNQAICVGEGEILGQTKQWWKDASSSVPGADWYWFNTDANRLPFRMMPYGAVDNAGWPGGYAFTYFSEYTAQSSTNLPALKQLCGISATEVNSAEVTPVETEGEPVKLADVLQQLLPPVEEKVEQAVGVEPVASFFPGVQQCSSQYNRPPAWPSTVEATTLLTAVNIKYSPFPSLVRYSVNATGLRTDMYNPWPIEGKAWNLYSARLHKLTGYSSYFLNDVYQSCDQDLPGPQVPNWMTVDNCLCKATLPPGTTLNPSSENTYIMMCPLTPTSQAPNSPQVFWTWYGAQSGTPVVFMQTNSSATAGTGLNLADYYSWNANVPVDPQIFIPPAGCNGQPKQNVPIQCHNCHLPTNDSFKSEGPVKSHIPIKE